MNRDKKEKRDRDDFRTGNFGGTAGETRRRDSSRDKEESSSRDKNEGQ